MFGYILLTDVKSRDLFGKHNLSTLQHCGVKYLQINEARYGRSAFTFLDTDALESAIISAFTYKKRKHFKMFFFYFQVFFFTKLGS